jgi:hypothetical protein
MQTLLVILLASQTIMEASRAPGSVPNEEFITFKSNIKLKMRVQCMGPYFENKTQPLTQNILLLEVGGGSAGPDLIGLQLKFK